MNEDTEYKEALKRLKAYGQEQLLNRYQYLDDEKKDKMIKQIKHIDFDQIIELYNERDKKVEGKECKITNIDYIDKSKLSKEEYDKYYNLGKKL